MTHIDNRFPASGRNTPSLAEAEMSVSLSSFLQQLPHVFLKCVLILKCLVALIASVTLYFMHCTFLTTNAVLTVPVLHQIADSMKHLVTSIATNKNATQCSIVL